MKISHCPCVNEIQTQMLPCVVACLILNENAVTTFMSFYTVGNTCTHAVATSVSSTAHLPPVPYKLPMFTENYFF